MSLKAAFKNSSFILQFFITVTIVISGMIFFSLIAFVIASIKWGVSIEELSSGVIQNAAMFREMQFLTSLGTFVLPALLLAYLFSDDTKDYLKMDTPVSFPIILMSMASMVAIVPALDYLVYLNSLMSLPDWMGDLENWMRQQEEAMKQYIEVMLYSENLGALLVNIIVIAVLAGIGEELMFRGVLQNVVRKLVKNEHLVIWIIAIIFSAIHMQFYGFFPRLLLGAYFGYLLYFTRCIWVPVLAHFTNNLYGVLQYYVYQDTDKIKELDNPGAGTSWWLVVVSLLLWGFLFFAVIKASRRGGGSQRLVQ